MRVNAVNYGVTNKQTNVASRAKRGMKQQPSFGMKMNNQHAAQKDTVSFGAPFIHKVEKELKEKSSMVSGLIGAPLGWLSAAIHEGIKESFDEPSTPREKKSRELVNQMTAGNTVVGALSSTVASYAQEEMVNGIASIYRLNGKEKSELQQESGIKFCQNATKTVGNTASSGILLAKAYASKNTIANAANEILSEIPGIGNIFKSGLALTATKILGEDIIKICKRIVSKRQKNLSGVNNDMTYSEAVLEASKKTDLHGRTGLSGYQFQDLLLRGPNSPYWRYYNTHRYLVRNYDHIEQKLNIVLPNSYRENLGFKFVNSPNHEDFDAYKDIYLQIFDKRYATYEEKNSNKLITSYENAPNNEDVVIPYYFPLYPSELEDKDMEDNYTIDNLDFQYYQINFAPYFSPEGNVNELTIEKHEFEYEDNKYTLFDNYITREYYKRMQEGINQASSAYVLNEKYSQQVLETTMGEEFTNIFNKLEIEGKSVSEIVEIMNSSKSPLKEIIYINEETAQQVIDHCYRIKDIDFFAGKKNYLLRMLMEQEFEILDTAPTLKAVLMSSKISPRCSKERSIGKSRFEIASGYFGIDCDVNPYEDIAKDDLYTYKRMDEIFKNTMYPFALEVFKNIETSKKRIFTNIDGEEDLTALGRYAIKFFMPDLFKFMAYKGLNPDIKPYVDEETGKMVYVVTDDERENLNLKNIDSYNVADIDYDAINVLNTFQKNLNKTLNSNSKEEISNILKIRLAHIDELSARFSSVFVEKAGFLSESKSTIISKLKTKE